MATSKHEYKPGRHVLSLVHHFQHLRSYDTTNLYGNDILYYIILYLSVIGLGYGLDNRGFESRKGLGIFPFSTASRPVPVPSQPPIQ
jgi:hypothetical protein